MLKDLIHDHHFVKIYGKVEFKIPASANIDLEGMAGLPSGTPSLVSVLGVKVHGQCIKYDRPVFAVLPGAGSKVTNCKCWDDVPDVMEWSVARDATLAAFSPVVGEASELLSTAPLVGEKAACISVTINNGKACLNIPVIGHVCIDIPDWVPNGTLAEACIDTCSKWHVPCGAEVDVKVAGQVVASEKFGCC